MSVPSSPMVSGSDPREFPLIYDRPRPDGTTLEVRRVQLPDGGSVKTFTDVTERHAAERRCATASAFIGDWPSASRN